MRAPVWCILLALTIAACSGGNPAIPHAPGGTPSHVKVTVTFKVAVPGARRAPRGHRRKQLSARLKRIWTIAENTAGIKVVAYASGDRTSPLGTAVADITAGSASCGATDPYGGRSCTLNLQAPPGRDDFVATTYDAAPVGGVIPAGANQLGYGVTTQTIVAGTPASVTLAIAGVLSKITLAVTPSSIHTIVPSRATLNVYATDADNDVIVSNGYIDGDGNAVTVGLSLSNVLPLVGSSAASLSLSPGSIAAPQPAGVAVTYAPPANGVVSPSNQTVTVSASPSASSIATTPATIAALPPSFSSLAAANLNTPNPYHGGMTFDGITPNADADDVYFTAPSGFGSIYECQACAFAAAPAIASTSGTSTNPLKGGIAGDGGSTYLLNASSFTYAVAGTTPETIGPGPGQTPFPSFTSAPAPNGSAMAYDSSIPAFWYASGTTLMPYPISGNSTIPAVAIGVATVGGIAIDSNHNPWVVDTVNNKIIECTSCTSAPSLVTGSLQSGGAAFDDVALGTRVFVTDHQAASPAILEVAASASTINIVRTLAMPAGLKPYYLTADRAQSGIFWFDYLSGTQIGVGRVDTNVSPPAFLMATAPASSEGSCNGSATAAAGVAGIGPTGTIYLVYDDNGCLMRVQR